MRDAPFSETEAELPGSASPRRALWWIILPLLAFAAAIAVLVSTNPLARFNNGTPPVEDIAFERVILGSDGIRVLVRAGGSEPMTIAQVQVDDAYWQFTQDPPGPLARGSSAWIQVPFPWVLGEAHAINLVTNTGATFAHDIPVAVATPIATNSSLLSQAILGIFVGVVPVTIGLMFYPALRGVGRNGMNFLLAVTVGLLAFLMVDAIGDAFELAAESAAVFQGNAMVVLAAAASFLILMGIGRRNGAPKGLALATYIAIGIGLHNFGEGLAIGAAFAAGAAGLGTFLVIGFTLHNVTEGIGIAAPILRERIALWTFAWLTLLAGGPAVLGLWIGSLAFAPQWSALALAIGAGAILQVIVEVTAMMRRREGPEGDGLFSPAVMSGLAAGAGFMYLTAMLVKI
ncbi:metal transporter [Aminobacter sp. SR38]|jgi:zinc transporter ZupT|uniref:ZIP family metal transporter n=1 Tax=Aminobacter TaxID=31988 RepID=UPI0017873CB8|nr:metal transporter [Aminobacter sp. SR38]QOF70481.1 metal transporter [Aminobacter sp. SR38]